MCRRQITEPANAERPPKRISSSGLLSPVLLRLRRFRTNRLWSQTLSDDILDQGRTIVEAWDEGKQEEARQLLDAGLPLGELFSRLGADALGAGAMRDDLEAAGRRIYEKITASARVRLCGNDDLRNFADPVYADTGDAISMLAVVASLVAEETGHSINSLLVAALILRIGIRRLCEKA